MVEKQVFVMKYNDLKWMKCWQLREGVTLCTSSPHHHQFTASLQRKVHKAM